MNTLICLPCLLTGGTEIQTLNLVQALVEGGHRVVTVCYFEHSSEMVERFKQAGSEVVLLSAEGKRIGGWKGIRFLHKGMGSCRERVSQCCTCTIHDYRDKLHILRECCRNQL